MYPYTLAEKGHWFAWHDCTRAIHFIATQSRTLTKMHLSQWQYQLQLARQLGCDTLHSSYAEASYHRRALRRGRFVAGDVATPAPLLVHLGWIPVCSSC